MSLIITVMLEPAKLQMNWAEARGRSILRGETVIPPTFRSSVMWLLTLIAAWPILLGLAKLVTALAL
jgi:hypothetical protein